MATDINRQSEKLMLDLSIQHSPLTEADLMALPRDGNKYEYVDGKLTMTPAGMEHGYIAVRLVAALHTFVDANKLGIVCDSSTGFWMKSGNCRAPDISFIARERLKGFKRPTKKFFQGAPDLTVEILSPSDTVETIHTRIVEYFDNSTQLCWVINPEEEIALIYHSPQPDRILRAGDLLDGETIVPGFTFPIASLFAEFEF